MASLPMRVGFLPLAVIGVLLLAGCTSLPTSGDYVRSAPTGIAPGEAIAVALKIHRRPDGEAVVGETAEEAFADCISKAVRETSARLVIAKAGEPQVRYRVDLWVETSDSPHEWEVAGAQGGFAIGRSWIETSTFRCRWHRDGLGERSRGTRCRLRAHLPVPDHLRLEHGKTGGKRFGEQLARLISG